jgi:hypothetical protein
MTYSGTFTFKTFDTDGNFTGTEFDGPVGANRIGCHGRIHYRPDGINDKTRQSQPASETSWGTAVVLRGACDFSAVGAPRSRCGSGGAS